MTDRQHDSTDRFGADSQLSATSRVSTDNGSQTQTDDAPGQVLIACDPGNCMQALQACGIEYATSELIPDTAAWCNERYAAMVPAVAVVGFESRTEGPLIVQSVLANHPAARVVAFAKAWDDSRKLTAVTSGVNAVMNCSDGHGALLTTIVNELAESRCLLERIGRANIARKDWLQLDASEYYVLRAAFVGDTNLAVSIKCDISVRTVDRLRHRALRKLGGDTLLDVVLSMHEAGLRTLPSDYSDLLLEIGRLQTLAHPSSR